MDLRNLTESLVAITEEAGRAILAIYGTDFEARSKDDSSPVTEAEDRKSVV